uniref:COP9 signalosome complex subunit 4 n=1 Tax=Macrostomum lignano TaxID=282301 RepID=A0A1I8JH41_9PLAT
ALPSLRSLVSQSAVDQALTLMHPYFLANFLMAGAFIITKTLPPVCDFLFDNCLLELRQWEIFTFLGCVIVFKNKRQPTVASYLTNFCMYAKMSNMASLLRQPVYRGPDTIVYFNDKTLEEELKSCDPRVYWLIEFYAVWSPPCADLAPVFARLSNDYGLDNLRFGKLDVTKYPKVAEKYGIDQSGWSRQLPTVALFKANKEVDRRPLVGAKKRVARFVFSYDNLVSAFGLAELYNDRLIWTILVCLGGPMSAQLEEELRRISAIDNASVAVHKYELLLKTILNQDLNAAKQQLQLFLNFLLDESVGLAVSRQVVADLVELLSSRIESSAQVGLETCQVMLACLQNRAISFEDQIVGVRQLLARGLEAQGRYLQAAEALAAIDMESVQKQFSRDEKARVLLKTVELYLREKDADKAEQALSRCQLAAKDPPHLQQYKVYYARVLDLKGKFYEAAMRYIELSLQAGETEHQMQHLEAATVCTVLCPASSQRSAMLARLYKDERSQRLAWRGLVEKLFRERLVRRDELLEFSASLQPHQRQASPNSDGLTTLEAAVAEHNLLAVSRLYNNISLAYLGQLLEVQPERAEQMAARMIAEQRLVGCIDQIRGFVQFEERHPMSLWDCRIRDLCEQVNSVCERVAGLHPDWYQAACQANV